MLRLGTLALLGLSTALAGQVEPLRIEGVITAVFTPYYANGTVNLGAVPSMAEYQKSMGVKGVFVGGTTGDSLSLSMAERKSLAEAWALAAKENNLLFIVHVGAEALSDAIELSRHAEAHGAVAVGCMSSVFFKPATVDALAQWLQQVGNAAPTLPLYYYHIPSMTGVNFKMLDLLKAAERIDVPTLVGIKYTGLYEPNAFPDFERCMNYRRGRYEVLCGREEMTLEALSIGTRGFIGSQFNFVADLYGAISKAWQNNMTYARDLQASGLALIDIWNGVPVGVNGNRLVMDYSRLSIGSARLPYLLPDSATRHNFLQSIGAWCAKVELLGLHLELCKGSKGGQPSVIL